MVDFLIYLPYALWIFGGWLILHSIISSMTHYAADERNTAKWGRRIEFIMGLVLVIFGFMLAGYSIHIALG